MQIVALFIIRSPKTFIDNNNHIKKLLTVYLFNTSVSLVSLDIIERSTIEKAFVVLFGLIQGLRVTELKNHSEIRGCLAYRRGPISI